MTMRLLAALTLALVVEAAALAQPATSPISSPEGGVPASPEITLPGVAFIQWGVANEANIQEFHVLRADAPEGPYERISTIPAQGPGLHGNQQYEFEERNLDLGRVLFYKIDYRYVDGSSMEAGPVRYVVEEEEEQAAPTDGEQP